MAKGAKTSEGKSLKYTFEFARKDEVLYCYTDHPEASALLQLLEDLE